MNSSRVLERLEENFSSRQSRIGKDGRLIVQAVKKDSRTHLIPLYRRIPYQWQGFHYQDVDDQPFLQLHHSAGGLTSGDTAAVYLGTDSGTRCLVTTTEATRYYRTDVEQPAHEVVNFNVGPGSVLEYLPDETIPYAHSKIKRETTFDLHSDSQLIASDILSGGRLSYRDGEIFEFDLLHSKNIVKVGSRRIFVDNLILDKFNAPVVLDSWMGFQVLSTVFAYSWHLDDEVADEVVNLLSEIPNIKSGVSFQNSLLVVKVLTEETWLAHEIVHAIWSLIRPRVLSKPSLKIIKG